MKIVLVVDDDTDIRELIVWKLTHAGYGTLSEGNGASGLAAAGGASSAAWGVRPDLVILDWTMPEMSGLDVLRALRADPATARIPVIMLTAKAQEAHVEQGFAAGVDDYIVKPFSPRELVSRVEALLNRVEAGR